MATTAELWLASATMPCAMAGDTTEQPGSLATVRVAELFHELLSCGHRAASGDSVLWAGVGCPCRCHHAVPVSPGNGKGSLGAAGLLAGGQCHGAERREVTTLLSSPLLRALTLK